MSVVAADHLRAFVERIMRLKEEQDTLATDIREVYAEAKGMGFDKQAMGQLVTYLRKKEKDGAKLEEQSAIFELYRDAYEHGLSHAHTREGRANQSPAGTTSVAGHLSTGRISPTARNHDEGGGSANTGGGHEVAETEMLNQSTVAPNEEQTSLAAREGEQVAAPIQAEESFEPPTFLVKKSALRPHCQNPDECAGYGAKHCHSCLKAAAVSEAA